LGGNEKKARSLTLHDGKVTEDLSLDVKGLL
jgi:hypothetical protein